MIARLQQTALAVLLTASTSFAQGSVEWKTVGNWDIAIDPSLKNGCFATALWNGGTIMRIGRNPTNETFYFLIGNEKWASLEPDVSYDVQIQFGNRPVWDVSAFGHRLEGGEMVFLRAQSSKIDFIREFQRAVNMKIFYDGAEIDNLKLTGSRRAWDEVESCQREVAKRDTQESPVDPFASSKPRGDGRKAVDPFAN
jgi:hypothetical protein